MESAGQTLRIAMLLPKRTCPGCGEPRCTKGNHTLLLRTVFGRLTVKSPRVHHCVCRPHETKTFSSLAELLPDHTLPDLLFLETKRASLMTLRQTAPVARGWIAGELPTTAADRRGEGRQEFR
jgi:hypothetical protein